MTAPPIATDVVYAILGVDEDSAIARLRNQKPEQVAALQKYYDAIFAPEDSSAAQFDVTSRALVAVRVASHTRSTATADWYANLARSAGATDEQLARVRSLDDTWADESALGAAIRRADLITLTPAAAEKADIDTLSQAGLSPSAVLSLSQVIAFVSYQVRFIALLRAIGGQS